MSQSASNFVHSIWKFPRVGKSISEVRTLFRTKIIGFKAERATQKPQNKNSFLLPWSLQVFNISELSSMMHPTVRSMRMLWRHLQTAWIKCKMTMVLRCKVTFFWMIWIIYARLSQRYGMCLVSMKRQPSNTHTSTFCSFATFPFQLRYFVLHKQILDDCSTIWLSSIRKSLFLIRIRILVVAFILSRLWLHYSVYYRLFYPCNTNHSLSHSISLSVAIYPHGVFLRSTHIVCKTTPWITIQHYKMFLYVFHFVDSPVSSYLGSCRDANKHETCINGDKVSARRKIKTRREKTKPNGPS